MTSTGITSTRSGGGVGRGMPGEVGLCPVGRQGRGDLIHVGVEIHPQPDDVDAQDPVADFCARPPVLVGPVPVDRRGQP